MEHDEDGYEGPATLVVGSTELAVEVSLAGHFEPIDGRYHWYGRLRPSEELADLLGSRRGEGQLRTPFGTAEAQLTDPDPWGRYRVTGTSRPPFPVPTTLQEIDRG
ncbi:DUF4873 domain-containing protein [Actinophytocola xanthii]|uniref:DUF4873 domain-containing protein n=1 Tax=Actinophytocola xanthii TaxID=1912961 RepID=A0A1Q8CDS1_9PSEU|nr:DUF4873 domain-containing protein [Actinophytocola xanthii]OLF12479.1 DUF4873 domain-containing protein [Actinophytocola xanthii]